jgi:hypothetical protein
MENCYSCHFLIQSKSTYHDSSKDHFFPIRDHLVELLKKDDHTGFDRSTFPACAYDCFRNKYDKDVFEHPRCEGLLYKERIEQMAVGAAKIIDKREKETKRLEDAINRSVDANRVANRSFKIAIAGFAVSVIFNIVNLVISVYPGLRF